MPSEMSHASRGPATYCCPLRGPHRRCHLCRSQAGWRGRQALSGCKIRLSNDPRVGQSSSFLRLYRSRERSSLLACSSAIVRSLISARADPSNSLMSAACSGVWLGSRPITVRLRTSRRTLSSLACNSASVGMSHHNGGCSSEDRTIAACVFSQRPLAISRAFTPWLFHHAISSPAWCNCR